MFLLTKPIMFRKRQFLITLSFKRKFNQNLQKDPQKLQKSINLEAKSIATNLKLSEQIEKLAEVPAYITLKDHKKNFRSKPPDDDMQVDHSDVTTSARK